MAYAYDQELHGTSVEIVDDQHQKLFSMINEILGLRPKERTKEKLSEGLDFLASYVVEHFEDEERVMAQRNFPLQEENKAAHKAFLARYAELRSDFDKDGPTSEWFREFRSEVGGWLVHHILAIDTKLRDTVEAENELTLKTKRSKRGWLQRLFS